MSEENQKNTDLSQELKGNDDRAKLFNLSRESIEQMIQAIDMMSLDAQKAVVSRVVDTATSFSTGGDKGLKPKYISELQRFVAEGRLREYVSTQLSHAGQEAVGDNFVTLQEMLKEALINPVAPKFEKENQISEENQKTPEVNRESVVERTNGSWGSSSPSNEATGSPAPEANAPFEQTVTSHPTLSSHPLYFSISGDLVSSKKEGYYPASEPDLKKLNQYAASIQDTARWYLENLADTQIRYIYRDTSHIGSLKVNFQKGNFAHLTGISPIGTNQSAEKTLEDFASGNGNFKNIFVRRGFVDKLKVLPAIREIIETQSFLFDDLSEVEKFSRIKIDKAIRSEDKDLLLAFRTDDGVSFPASLLRLRRSLNLTLDSLNQDKIILGVFRERNGVIDTLSVNTDYIKDGGKQMKEVLESQNLQPINSEILKQPIEQTPLSRLPQVGDIVSRQNFTTQPSVTTLFGQIKEVGATSIVLHPIEIFKDGLRVPPSEYPALDIPSNQLNGDSSFTLRFPEERLEAAMGQFASDFPLANSRDKALFQSLTEMTTPSSTVESTIDAAPPVTSRPQTEKRISRENLIPRQSRAGFQKAREEAHSKNILEVAQSLGMDLERSGQNYKWRAHDSLVLSPEKNIFSWFSRDLSGDPIQLVQTIQDVSYREAVSYLTQGHFERFTAAETTKEPFRYTLSSYENKDLQNARKYLKKERGLSDETIDFFRDQGVLAEAAYRSDNLTQPVVVFKSLDVNKQIIGTSLQGIEPHPDLYDRGQLKKIGYRSDGQAGMNVTIGTPKRLVFAESPIDLMSYYELRKENLQDTQLIAMDGLKSATISRYAADALSEGQYSMEKTPTESRRFLKVLARTTDYLKEHPDFITLAVDNDTAGREFIENLQASGIPVKSDLPPLPPGAEKNDWNDQLKTEKREGVQAKMETKTSQSPTLDELIATKDTRGLSQHLEEGIKDYFNSDTYRNYLDAMAKLPQYSSRNVMLLQRQKPDLHAVQSVGAWKKFDPKAHPKEGSKALRIFAPIEHKVLDDNNQPKLDKDGNPITWVDYRMTPVFDLSQMSLRKKFPQPIDEIVGKVDGYRDLYKAVKAISDVPISFGETKGANGFYSPGKKQIVLQRGMSENMTLKTLLHELTHAENHTNSKADYGDRAYRLQEFEAESTAYVVCAHYGFDTSDYSFGYLANWGLQDLSTDQLKETMKKVQAQAKSMMSRIDTSLEKVKNKTLNPSTIQTKLKEIEKRPKADLTPHKGEVSSQEKKLGGLPQL